MSLRFILSLLFLTVTAAMAFTEEGPPAYILPATDRVIILLGDTPRNVHGFHVERRDPGSRTFRRLTEGPVKKAGDPVEAVRLMGSDFQWIARKMGTIDPYALWNRLNRNRGMTLSMCLVSHGLRLAMGRTWIDPDTKPGEQYRYRVVLLDRLGSEVDRYEQNVRVTAPSVPDQPKNVESELDRMRAVITWEYPSYTGSGRDLTAGFHVYRKVGNGAYRRITAAPALRAEGFLSFIDNDLPEEGVLTYRVHAVDMIGVISEGTEAPPLTVSDTSPPLVPTGITAVEEEEGGGTLLVWRISPELDADHYIVYRGESMEDDSEFNRINSEPIPARIPRYLDRDIVRGVNYHYRVAAVDMHGNESGLSGPASITLRDSDPPPETGEVDFRVNERKRWVTLSWEAVQAADLRGYFIYRGKDPGSLIRVSQEPVKPGNNPSFTDRGYEQRGLKPGDSLYYGVSAVDTSSNESGITRVEVKIPDAVPPDPPAGLRARPTTEGSVRLTWQPVYTGDLAGYRIYRKRINRFVLTGEVTGSFSSWIDEEVEAGKEYIYRITSFDDSDNESEVSSEVSIVPTDLVPPPPPPDFGAELKNRRVELTWSDPGTDDIAGYRLYRAEYTGAPWKQVTDRTITRTSFSHRDGVPGNVYAVSAVDTSGNEGERSLATVVEESGR